MTKPSNRKIVITTNEIKHHLMIPNIEQWPKNQTSKQARKPHLQSTEFEGYRLWVNTLVEPMSAMLKPSV